MSYKRVPLAAVAAPQDQDRLAALEAAGRLGTALTPAEAEARRPEPPDGPKIKAENSENTAQIVLESAQPVHEPIHLVGASGFDPAQPRDDDGKWVKVGAQVSFGPYGSGRGTVLGTKTYPGGSLVYARVRVDNNLGGVGERKGTVIEKSHHYFKPVPTSDSARETAGKKEAADDSSLPLPKTSDKSVQVFDYTDSDGNPQQLIVRRTKSGFTGEAENFDFFADTAEEMRGKLKRMKATHAGWETDD